VVDNVIALEEHARAISRHSGFDRKSRSRSIAKCLNSSFCAFRTMARALVLPERIPLLISIDRLRFFR
jgi:hypothetical protein